MMHLDVHLPAQRRITAPAAKAHDPFDADWARSIMTTAIEPLLRQWFRAEIVGAERIPQRGPVILAANHSGNAFPYDAIALDALLWSRDGMTDEAKFRTVYEYELSLVWWMRPFGIDDFWRRGGGVDMTFDNFDALLRRGDRTLYFPEGVPGIGKGFGRRYQLQRFHTSFIRLAARHDVPILPVYVVNGEWIHPIGYTFRWLDWIMQRLFVVPFLPLPIGLLAVVFPWMWYLAFPARLVFVVGEPIDVTTMVRKAPTVEAATEAVRELMQRGLDESVSRFGKSRYAFPELWRRLRYGSRGRWRAIPTGWPLSFIRHERDRARPPARSRLHAILRDLDLVAFYLPFGWPLLSLARMLRRAPYGHRGTSRLERAMREGRFVWRLSERPLPPRSEATRR
jgi:1-acyl-sn-glycerol-3-phosphate acyltransferase